MHLEKYAHTRVTMNTNKTYKTLLTVLALAAGLMVSASCQKEPHTRSGKKIKVHVTAENTKGTVTTTDILKSSGAFSMLAYLSGDYYETDNTLVELPDGKYFSGDGNVTLSSGSWVIEGTPKWVAGVDSHFWAWHPVTVAGRSTPTAVKKASPEAGDPKYPYTGELTFSYTTPTPSASQGDADCAIDLLFAYTRKNYSGGDVLNITFHHALSQVRFCVSTDDGTFDKSLKIKDISISGLKTSGNATFTDSGSAEADVDKYGSENGAEQFDWKNQSGSKDFSQTYNADFSTSTVSGWTKGSYTKSGSTFNLYTCENVFFMIPQTVLSANKITVTFDYKGVETVKTISIADSDGDTWLGDHYYTYKIMATTVGRNIDMSVSLVGWTNRKEDIFI